MKVFQIGFSKCGTTSIHKYCLSLGLNSVGHRQGQITQQLKQNAAAGRYILTGLEEYDAFTDMRHLD